MIHTERFFWGLNPGCIFQCTPPVDEGALASRCRRGFAGVSVAWAGVIFVGVFAGAGSRSMNETNGVRGIRGNNYGLAILHDWLYVTRA